MTPLTWTNEVPTRPGFYRLMAPRTGMAYPEVVEVMEFRFDSLLGYCRPGTNVEHWLRDAPPDARWAGPLAPPQE